MPCPQCRKPPQKATAPFCSTRCQQLDLGKWFSGSYAVPAVDTDEFSELEGEAESSQKDD